MVCECLFARQQHNNHQVLRQLELRVSAADGMKCVLCFFSLLQLLELIAKSQLPSLSGVAQKNYMNILERVVQKGEPLFL